MTATAKYPAALFAAADYGGQVVNRQSLTQSGTVDTVVTTIVATTAIPASWPSNGRVVLDSEVIWYGAKSGSTLTGCTRGAEGTAAATHTGATIFMNFTADQLNQVAVEIIALQTKVGADASATASTHDFKLSEVSTGSSDKAVGKVATQTMTNKTLTSPVLNTPTIGTSVTISSATFKVIPGATSFGFRNNADNADNLLITDAGAITVRSSISGVTTLTATTLGGTLSTAAQPNVTSVGTLTSLTIAGNLTFTAAVTKVIPGATSIDFRNTSDANSNLLIANNGDITVRAQIIGVTTLTATTLAGTLSTAAQPNVTSVGTLTALTISGALTFTAAVGKIVPGATSISLRNTADNADNILIADNGNITVRGTLSGVTTLTATNIGGTLTTAAQGAITSVGTLTALTVSGTVSLTGAVTINTGALIVNTAGTATFNRQYFAAAFAVAFAGTPTYDWNNGNVQTTTLTGNITSMAFSNVQAGARYILILTQDATGGRTVVWPAAVKWSGGVAPSLSALNKTDIISLVAKDSSNIYATIAGAF